MVFRQPGPEAHLGVLLPWTLADAALWAKSWRLASRLFMVMGVTALISWRAFYISSAHLVGLSCLYPALLYRWKYSTWRFWKGQGWIDYRPVVRCAHCGHLQPLTGAEELLKAECRACGAGPWRTPGPGPSPRVCYRAATWLDRPERLLTPTALTASTRNR